MAVVPVPDHPGLLRSVEEKLAVFWTPGLGDPPSVYGERVVYRESAALRRWDPGRSKWAAALVRGYDGPTPRPGERWLYLGAATGTTASHVADLVGRDGAVFAVEKSLRPFARLLALAERYPNLYPILGDARAPREYLDRVPPVDGVYADVAQPDQVRLFLENLRWFLRATGTGVLALKTASLGRSQTPAEHLARTRAELEGAGPVGHSIDLAPYHRRHYLLDVAPRRGWLDGGAERPVTPRPRHRLVVRRR